MRYLPLLALTGASMVQAGPVDQFGAWFNNLKTQLANSVSSPVDAVTGAIAGAFVQPLGMQNWKSHIWPKPDEEQEWMVYMTGGNKSCFGRCENADRAWNQSVPLLKALPQAANKPTLKLGTIDCESNEILCVAWSAGVPAIWHFLTPATASSPDATTDLRIIRLNTTTVNVGDITSIPSASKSRYEDYKTYDGILHPIDGAFQKYGVSVPFGYILWIMGAIPSWLMMLVISFASRQIMNKRMGEGGALGAPPAAAAPAGAQPAAPAGGAGKASPAGGKKQKKR